MFDKLKYIPSYNKNEFLSYSFIFILYLSFITAVGLGFQYFIVGLFYPSNSEFVLFSPDSMVANQHAIDLALRLEVDFFKYITPFPSKGFSLNTALVGICYFLFGIDPYINIFINSFFHASSAFLLFLIFLKLRNITKASIASSFLCSIIFLIWPSSILWLSEISKDYICFFTFILYIYGILVFHSSHLVTERLKGIIYITLSITLLYFIRDHYIQFYLLIILAYIIYFIIINRFEIFNFTKKNINKTFLLFILCLLLFMFQSSLSNKDNQKIAPKELYNNFEIVAFDALDLTYKSAKGKEWKSYSIIPEYIDQKLRYISSINIVGKDIAEATNAETILNENLFFLSSSDFIKYAPLIFYQSFFEPYPLKFNMKEAKHLLSSFEMIIIYFCYAMIFFLKRKDFTNIMFFIFFALIIHIFVFTIISSTYGTLYRIRSPYILLFALLILKPFAEKLINKFKHAR